MLHQSRQAFPRVFACSQAARELLFRLPMTDNNKQKAEGTAEKLGGKVKGAVGKLLDNEQMEAEGKAKEAKGTARVESAKAAERTKGKVEEVTGAVKNRVGAAIDNEQMQAEGKARELKGEARQHSNR